MTDPTGGRGKHDKPTESVWDFPRPPRVERVDWRVRVVHRGQTVADSADTIRVLETSQPPAYYIPPEHVNLDVLHASEHSSMCEWKGQADYAHLQLSFDGTVDQRFDAAWTYRTPMPAFLEIAHHWAFYAQKFDECWVDDERVVANDGSFYGGWITRNVTGPFKGGPGTLHW